MKPFIHLEDDHPGRVVAWTSAFERPTFLMRYFDTNIVQLIQFLDQSFANEWLDENPNWDIITRLDGSNGRS